MDASSEGHVLAVSRAGSFSELGGRTGSRLLVFLIVLDVP